MVTKPQPEPVVHPEWCDRSKCTAPDVRPLKLEKGERCGEHLSERLLLPGIKDLRVFLSQSVAPWGTGTFLRMQTADGSEAWSTQIGEGGAGFQLFELMAKEVGAQAREWPTLYGERFGYVAEATKPEELQA